jgi:adenine-specific DNA methylase
MLKRLIEVALPLKEVSEQSAREKSIRQGNISTMHIWWARRPLAACRAAVFASLIPDADDPECPESFRSLVKEVLRENQYTPTNDDGSAKEDTPRNRCLQYLKHLVKWENANKSHYTEPARKLIAAAHKILHPMADADVPKVLDPFAGGGAIPLEALRLGCKTHAIDLNPVAHLIELCTVSYPQEYGQPNSRPVPDYIKRQDASRTKGGGNGQATLFDAAKDDFAPDEADNDLDPATSGAEYRRNPLAADVKYWGHWILTKVQKAIEPLFPRSSGGKQSVAYFWARTVKCVNPACGATIPLVRQLWLAKSSRRKIALRLTLDDKAKRCNFETVQGNKIDFDPSKGTMQQGSAYCPFCQTVANGAYLREQARNGHMGTQLMAVAYLESGRQKVYEGWGFAKDFPVAKAEQLVDSRKGQKCFGNVQWLPIEPVPSDRPAPNSRGLSGVQRYGCDAFHKLFSIRQLAVMIEFASAIREAVAQVMLVHDLGYGRAVGTYLAFALSKLADRNSANCVWRPQTEAMGHSFSRQALQMVWDYVEINPLDPAWGWNLAFEEFAGNLVRLHSVSSVPATCLQASAAALPFEDAVVDCIVTDPPYYESVPYSDLSDFFYVWLRRCVGDQYETTLSTPLTPKAAEIIAYYGSGQRKIQKTPAWYEEHMAKAFAEIKRLERANCVSVVMFAHKTTAAWETLIGALLAKGLVVTASWPIHTERKARMVAIGTASLASSVTLVCRKRDQTAGIGLWDDVRKELKPVAKERLDFFWSQGIRGADFFISAIGPALSVFGKYEKVTKLSGDEVSVGQFLDEVRSLVTAYALNKIMKTTHTATIDAESQFYVIWKWSYGEAKVPADESFKLAQALGMDTELIWDRTGVLEKAGENVLAVPVAKRMKIKDLGEPNADNTPASIIDVLHRLCVFRDKNDTEGMTEFLARSGQGRNPSLWLVAQAVSEILPDGDKEKQLMQGLLNQRDQLEEAGRQQKLF